MRRSCTIMEDNLVVCWRKNNWCTVSSILEQCQMHCIIVSGASRSLLCGASNHCACVPQLYLLRKAVHSFRVFNQINQPTRQTFFSSLHSQELDPRSFFCFVMKNYIYLFLYFNQLKTINTRTMSTLYLYNSELRSYLKSAITCTINNNIK